MFKLRIGMAQILVEAGQPQANLRRAVASIDLASAKGCHVVVLPECLDLGWSDPCARRLAEPIPGPHFALLAQSAREQGIHVVAGLVERAGTKNYNAAVLIDPQGGLLLLHRKINELDFARDLYAVGDRLGVAETRFGIVGLTICADNFPDSLAIGHVLARMGARLLLSPSAWAVPADHDNTQEPYGDLWMGAYRQLCTLYEMPIIGVSGVGMITEGCWKGRRLVGCSLAMDSQGRILALGPYGEECLLTVEVTLQPSFPQGSDIASELNRRGYQGP